MSSDAPKKEDGGKFDVVLVHGTTPDGDGARVVRARPGRLEAGEVRPVREGKPLMPGGEIVQLVKREGLPLYDVNVECEIPGSSDASATRASGPAQVATQAYRDSWERTFGTRGDQVLN